MGDDFEIKPLTTQTWNAFAGLVERHTGILFLYDSTRALYEEHGFVYVRATGKGHGDAARRRAGLRSHGVSRLGGEVRKDAGEAMKATATNEIEIARAQRAAMSTA